MGSLPSPTCLFNTPVPGTELGPRKMRGRVPVFSSGVTRVRDRGSPPQGITREAPSSGKRVWRLKEGSVERFFGWGGIWFVWERASYTLG